MPPPGAVTGLLPSVLDRLTDPDSAGTAGRQGYGLRQMEDAVRRDLEDLLNTRRPPDDLFLGLDEVGTSVANFGLRDLASLDALTPVQRGQFAAHIEAAIRAFEPRLCDVSVAVRDPDEVQEHRKSEFKKTALYFHITARLNLDPSPDISFETVLELSKGHHQILKDGS